MVREVEGVSILAWDPGQPQAVVSELRRLVEGGGVKHVLLDLSEQGWIRADSIESLSEATTVCSDRDCPIGMFGVEDDFAQLVKVMSLAAYLPPLLGANEDDALGAIQRQDTLPEAPKLDIQIDLATAPTARFDPKQVAASVGPEPTPLAAPAPAEQGLLAVNWADLTQTGYTLSGPDAGAIMAVCKGGETTPPSPDEGVIDLGDDAPAQAAPAAPVAEATETAAGVLESDDDDGDFSPLDSGTDGPPAFLKQTGPAAHAPTQRQAPLPRQVPPPAQPPARQQPAVQPAAQRQAPPQPVAPAANMFAGDGDDAAVMMQLTPEALAAAVQSYDAGASDDQAVMFTPDAAAMAQLAEAAAQATGAAAPADAPASSDYYAEGSDDDQAVMFQPGDFDAALLAEVAAAAGPEAPIPVPEPIAPPEPQPINGEEGELRTFLRDYAIRSALHVQVLERFLLAGEDALGPKDLQAAGKAAAMRSILDELVQCRLVRRTRCSRVRGGTGFMFSPSPATRNQIVRLIKLWQGPETRSQVASWLAG
jgi:hypothetical protein